MSNEPAAAAAPAAPVSAPSAAPASAPKTASDALKGAEARLTATASPAVKTPDQGVTEGKPPAGAQPAPTEGRPATPPPGEGNIAQLRNAYEGTKKQLEALAWAGQLNRDDVQAALSLLQDLRKDPVSFYRQLNQDLTGHPEYSKALQPPSEDPEPQADLLTKGPDGQSIKVYSDSQLQKWRDWNNKRLMAQVDQRLNPLNEFHRNVQIREQQAAILHRAKTTTTEVMTAMRQLPHFAGDENEAKITEKLESIPKETRRRLGAIGSLQMAYNLHLRDNVFPTIGQSAEQKVRDEFARKANAGSGNVTPGGGSPPAVTSRPRNERELAAHLRKLAGVGS